MTQKGPYRSDVPDGPPNRKVVTEHYSCTCWPAGGPPCPDHGTYRVNPHHEHGQYYGNDNWDASCCICDDSPCSVITVEWMRRHRWYDIDRERLRSTVGGEDAPF